MYVASIKISIVCDLDRPNIGHVRHLVPSRKRGNINIDNM